MPVRPPDKPRARRKSSAGAAARLRALEDRVAALSLEIERHAVVEQALHESEERFAAAIDAAQVGTWSIDLRTGEDRWDASLNRIAGFPAVPTTRQASDSFTILHPDDCALATEAWLRFVTGARPTASICASSAPPATRRCAPSNIASSRVPARPSTAVVARRARPRGPLRANLGDDRRHHSAKIGPGTTQAGAEAGGDRPAHRRRRARLQQSADRHSGQPRARRVADPRRGHPQADPERSVLRHPRCAAE